MIIDAICASCIEAVRNARYNEQTILNYEGVVRRFKEFCKDKANPIRYAGYQYDKETGLYYLNARYYDSSIARFINEDTYMGEANDPLSLNLYTYCVNNPITYYDPTGHVSEKKAAQVIKDNAVYIISAAEEVSVNPAILASCIYAEQVLNVTYTEGLEDWLQSFLGLDCSVGIAQVRISTAKKIEDAGYIQKTGDLIRYSTRNYFGFKLTEKMVFTREERIYNYLTDNQTNISYAAAYLVLIQDKWKDVYPGIVGDAAILATLYNLGDNGGNKGINPQPKPNNFGIFAGESMDYMNTLLGLK